MTKVPAIQGSLVDAKNIAVHKTLRLSIDVPVENAARVLELFGWPTMVNPIAVAIAPLDMGVVQQQSEKPTEQKGGKLSRDAAFLCQTGSFHKFLIEHAFGDATNVETATDILRNECGIQSRAELDHNQDAARRFREIKSNYDAWMMAA
jgi:hypothetical protein